MASKPTDEIEIGNMQCVSVGGEQILVMAPRSRMSRQEALVHAAWLVALADHDHQFPEILKRVRNT
jgi:hypothetical protein